MTQSENRADPGAASQQRDIQQRQDQSDRRKEEEGRASVQKQGKEAVQTSEHRYPGTPMPAHQARRASSHCSCQCSSVPGITKNSISI